MVLKLYEFEGCPYCRKVREKLELLGLPYDSVECDPYNMPQVVKDLGNMVPVIDDEGHIMNESADIIVYLEKKYGK
ncbi:glutathione S-transferase N-terminal domain-containing protein [Candidatus Woesearchaeota archaeon]|nr:glutathione S-transferase N-terminal domain-containing protein [Candidatus Woesearchaeota archaeon]